MIHGIRARSVTHDPTPSPGHAPPQKRVTRHGRVTVLLPRRYSDCEAVGRLTGDSVPSPLFVFLPSTLTGGVPL